MDSDFARHFARFGPEAPGYRWTRARSQGYCSRLACRHYENFTVASLLLPRHLIRHFHNVYAYCRWADDLADETGGGPQALALLRWWREELLRCYGGIPRHPVMISLRATIERFNIPPQPFLDLLFAFEQDQLVKRYQTYEQLLRYCRHSANPVGRLVLYLCGSFDDARAELSDHVCTALQLANFWQDVARDLAIGRVYLPEEDLRAFGCSREEFHARRYTSSFGRLLRFEVDRTRELFQRGQPLVGLMPRELQIDIDLFIRGGLGILGKIEALGYNVWDWRPTLSKWEKGRMFLGAIWQRLRSAVL